MSAIAIWRVEDRAVDWFALEAGRYEPIAGEGGVVRSVAFPGLWLDAKALLTGDLAKVLECLERGLASEPSRMFRSRLGSC